MNPYVQAFTLGVMLSVAVLVVALSVWMIVTKRKKALLIMWGSLAIAGLGVWGTTSLATRDPEVAALKRQAKNGDPDAMYWLAKRYMRGQGVSKNGKKANRWYEKAAEAGDARAAYELYDNYSNGWGVPIDQEKAGYWLQRSEDMGYARSRWASTDLKAEVRTESADQRLYRIAREGDNDAAERIGMRFLYGQGVERNGDSARYWLKMAADRGDELAKQRLENMNFDPPAPKTTPKPKPESVRQPEQLASKPSKPQSELVATNTRMSKPAKDQVHTNVKDVSFHKYWIEHNVMENNVKGMVLHANFDVNNHKGEKLQVAAYFKYANGRVVKDINKRYNTVDGQAATHVNITPGYDNATYSDCKMFFPYDELHLAKGKHDLQVQWEIHDMKGKIIPGGSSSSVGFYVTQQVDNSMQNNRQSSTPQVARVDTRKNLNGAILSTLAPSGNMGYPEGKYVYVDLGTMGYQEMWMNDDGSSWGKNVWRCYSCQGSKQCNICFGTGNGYAMIGRYMPCPSCFASGRCGTCKGEGFTLFVKYMMPGEAEAYMETKRQERRSSSSSSNSRSTYSSRSTCSRCGGRRWNTERYSNCAASTSGAMQPYKNYAGTTCSVCGYSSEHCHYPCSECWGHGTVKNY